jgi:hypothetical protein
LFSYEFDFDEWPGTNTDTTRVLSTYNDSIFKLRFKYGQIFPKQFENDNFVEDLDEMKGGVKSEDKKVFKISYHVNLLTSMSNEDGYIMEELAKC